MRSQPPPDRADALDVLIDDVLRETVQAEAPPWLAARVAARLRDAEDGRPAVRARRIGWWPQLATAGLLAVAGLVVAVVFRAVQPPPGEAPSPGPVVATSRLPVEPPAFAPGLPEPAPAPGPDTGSARVRPEGRTGPRVVARSSAEALSLGLARAPETVTERAVLVLDLPLSDEPAMKVPGGIELEPIVIVPLPEPAPLSIPALEIVPITVPAIRIEPIDVKPIEPGRPPASGAGTATR